MTTLTLPVRDNRLRQATHKVYLRHGSDYSTIPGECTAKPTTPTDVLAKQERIRLLTLRADACLPLFETGPQQTKKQPTARFHCAHCGKSAGKGSGLPHAWRRVALTPGSTDVIIECDQCAREWDERWGGMSSTLA